MIKAISKPSLSRSSNILKQVKTKSVSLTVHNLVAHKSPVPRPDWSKLSSAGSTQRQKQLQRVAGARLKKYGSEKKVKAEKTSPSVPKTTAAVPSDGGGILAREFITRQGLGVFPPAPIASEQCTSDEEETRGSCRPAFTAAVTDETLTLSTLRSFSGGRLEASGKKMRAAREDGVPLPARGYPGLALARKVATLSRRPSPASPPLSSKIRRCDSATTLHPAVTAKASETREDDGSLMVVNPVFPFKPALRALSLGQCKVEPSTAGLL